MTRQLNVLGSAALQAGITGTDLTTGPASGGARAHAEGESGADLAARFFRVLGDPTRLRLLQLLLDAPSGEYSVGDLVAALNAPQSRVSTHLGCLRWCGLVVARRDGKQVYYRVGDPRVRDLLALGSMLLHDHAAGVASCGMLR
jgi:DNA-binding transcriptional ArsR family regulator